MGMGGLAFADLFSSTTQAANKTGAATGALAQHFRGKAKHIIHVFLNGGVSQVDTFDPKPELARRA